MLNTIHINLKRSYGLLCWIIFTYSSAVFVLYAVLPWPTFVRWPFSFILCAHGIYLLRRDVFLLQANSVVTLIVKLKGEWCCILKNGSVITTDILCADTMYNAYFICLRLPKKTLFLFSDAMQKDEFRRLQSMVRLKIENA